MKWGVGPFYEGGNVGRSDLIPIKILPIFSKNVPITRKKLMGVALLLPKSLLFLPQGLWVLQTIQMKLILLCVWEERVVLGSAKTALKLKYEI